VTTKLAAVVALLVASLAALAGAPGPASADPYTAQARTTCRVDVPTQVERGGRVTIDVEVAANSDTAPRGTLRVVLRHSGEQLWARTVRYDGQPVRLDGPALVALGRYEVSARFTPTDRSVFRGCSGSDSLRVVNDIDDGDDGDDGDQPDTVPPTDTDGTLPDTGGPHRLWLLLGAALVALGGGLVVASRRRPVTPYPVLSAPSPGPGHHR